MTCVECRDLMLEVARRRAAPFVDRRVLAHVAECGGCRARLEQERALTAALGQLAREADGAAASAHVEDRLMAAFAARAGATGGTTHSSPGSVSRWLPVAAALLLAAGAAGWWGSRPARVAPPTPLVARVEPVAAPAAAPSAPAPSAAVRAAEDDGPGRAITSVGSARARGGARAARATPPQAPIEAVGFVPIPSAAGLPAFESGEIVRLGIPVAALPNYGVEIPSGGQASIQADLLIGQDGQARAIRLVSATVDAPRPRQ